MFDNGQLNSSHILLGMYYLYMPGLKLIRFSKGGPSIDMPLGHLERHILSRVKCFIFPNRRYITQTCYTYSALCGESKQ